MSRSLRQVFAWPIVIGVLSTIGLVSALVGDGLWDAISWPTLGIVVVLAVWYGLPWRKGARGR